VTVTIPFVAAGEYYLVAVADSENAVGESDETNNVSSRKIVIGADLSVVAASAPTSASRGSTVTIRDTVQNIGGASAASSIVAYVLSADTTPTSSDIVLGTRTIESLTPGAGASCALRPSSCSTGATAVTIPPMLTTGRTYYLIVVSDALNAVHESHEQNNARVIPITIF
jgi:subtilase family serine protease